MNREQMKQAAAQGAMDYILPLLESTTIVGVGTGSTANFFIDYLAEYKDRFQGTVASSETSAQRLANNNIRVFDLNHVDALRVYVDGADEANQQLELIKGGGAALTREKIVAACAEEFVCIADSSKWVSCLGAFPLPVEVIPMAAAYVSRELGSLGGEARQREDCITDNGNIILDVYGLKISEPKALEAQINQLAGVVSCGIFAHRPADLLLLATQSGVETYTRA